MRGTVPKAIAGLALGLAAVAVTLAGAEVVVRLVEASAPPPAEPALDPELEGLPVLRGVRALAARNVRGIHGRALYRTNSVGIRGPEYTRKPPAGTFRIALVGDSFTMGWKISEEEIYAHRLRLALDAAARPGARFEVMNLGLGGLNIRQIVKRLEKVGLAFRPQLIAYGFTTNDILTASNRPEMDAERRNDMLADWFRFGQSPSHLLRIVWPRWISLRNAIWRPAGSHEHSLQGLYESQEDWERITDGLDRLATIGRDRGICVHLLIHSEVGQLRFLHPFTDIYDRVEAAARERGISVTQSFPYYRGKDSADLRVSLVDSHPNAEGHRLLAEALFDGLAGLPEACGLPLR